jgi:hypothetical protein
MRFDFFNIFNRPDLDNIDITIFSTLLSGRSYPRKTRAIGLWVCELSSEKTAKKKRETASQISGFRLAPAWQRRGRLRHRYCLIVVFIAWSLPDPRDESCSHLRNRGGRLWIGWSARGKRALGGLYLRG